MNKKWMGGALLLLLTAFASQAQEKKTLKLEEAVSLSLQSSKHLKIGQAKIDEAVAAQKEAKDRQLPDASFGGAYMRLNSPNINLRSKDTTGGGSGGSSPKVNQAMYGMLNLSLPIYSGGKIRYGIESASYLQKAVTLDAEANKEEVIQNTIEAFANLFKAKTAVRLMKENLEQSKERVREFTNLEKNGLLARNDLLKAELQSSNIELSLLDAENNWQVANLNMDLLLGLPTTTELLLDTSGINRRDDSRSLDEFLKTAIENRKDAQAAGLRKQAAVTSVKSIEGEMMPSVKLTGGYVALDVPHFLAVTNALNIGVGVNYNIASLWKTKAKVQQAEARVKEWELNNAILADNITLQVNRNYLSLVSYRKKIEVYAKAMEQAKENYRITKNKYDNNLVTTADLLEADLAQLQSTLSYTLARADAFVAYNKLIQSTGTLQAAYSK